jgi:hypothetical protein
LDGGTRSSWVPLTMCTGIRTVGSRPCSTGSCAG